MISRYPSKTIASSSLIRRCPCIRNPGKAREKAALRRAIPSPAATGEGNEGRATLHLLEAKLRVELVAFAEHDAVELDPGRGDHDVLVEGTGAANRAAEFRVLVAEADVERAEHSLVLDQVAGDARLWVETNRVVADLVDV